MAFDSIPRPTDWLGYINPREGRQSGLQGAHLFADKEWEPGRRFNFLTRLGYGPNSFNRTVRFPAHSGRSGA
ncbi:hypothetical protein [Sphingomonas yantingensis]|uniref:Uncharacterized protein n=1 Tax=Sphingomonas yantingensis TaxID=1241761 RepID=A0A7W9AP30_9SPHN|nr:hypothetical protein [Sphingomonas yantingensis]MBB5697796.1 hypothetical protein [Sphingomonas yantingensis]